MDEFYLPPNIGQFYPDGHYFPNPDVIRDRKGLNKAILEPNSNVYFAFNKAPNERLAYKQDLKHMSLNTLLTKLGLPEV